MEERERKARRGRNKGGGIEKIKFGALGSRRDSEGEGNEGREEGGEGNMKQVEEEKEEEENPMEGRDKLGGVKLGGVNFLVMS